MAAPLSICTALEQRSVIRFLSSEGVKPMEIHRRMTVQYGDSCLSLQQVYEWCRKFKSGIVSIEDAQRPGQAHRVVTDANIARAEEIVMDNRRITLKEIAQMLEISYGSAQNIVHNVLQFNKVSARWVPRQLTSELKERRVDACEELLRRFNVEGDSFLDRIVTGDETWVHYHQPETKRASKEWRHSSSPKPKKIRTQRSAGKVMLTLFWDVNGVILEHYIDRGMTVNSTSYSNLLKNQLRPAIRSKRRGLLTSGVLLQHDNARPHTARLSVQTIQDIKFECLIHPPYSPDLAPSDFHVFGKLKDAMGGKHFQSDEEVKTAVHEWLQAQPKEFFKRGIHALPKRWNTCITRQGDYVEK